MTPESNEKIRLGLFDIDGTIFRSGLLISITNVLLQAGLFPRSEGEKIRQAKDAWEERRESYHDYIMTVVRVYDRCIKGLRKTTVEDLARPLVADNVHRTYVYTRNLIKRAKEDGCMLIAISGSPQEIVEMFARRHGFHYAFGKLFEVDESGHYTGKILLNNVITDKAEVVRSFLEKQVFSDRIDYEGSFAVGDTYGDESMLKLVGSPIAFNPDERLVSFAREIGAKIVVERKSIAFELADFSVRSME